MTLKEYRENNGLTLEQLGRRIGISNRMTVSRYERGIRIPPRDVMENIRTGTAGDVLPKDFYPDPGPASPDLPRVQDASGFVQ